jgi:hypothetical protein
MWRYHILDYFFLVFHSGVVIFNLFGWIWRTTRRANLILLLLTGLSWFGLGLIYGIGFCPLTEWHWQTLAKLGERPEATSYMQYLAFRISGILPGAELVDNLTVLSFLFSLTCSILLNIRDFRRIRRNNPG